MQCCIGQCYHAEEGDEDRDALRAPVQRVVTRVSVEVLAEDERTDRGHEADHSEEGCDLVTLQEGDGEADTSRDHDAEAQLRPAGRLDLEQFADVAELDPQALEHDEVQCQRGHDVDEVVPKREEEAQGLPTARCGLHCPQCLRRVCGERPHREHVHREDANRDQHVLPSLRVVALQRRYQRQTNGHQGPGRTEVPDERTDHPEEPAQLRLLLHLHLEEVEAGDEDGGERDGDELDVVHLEDVVEDLLSHVIPTGNEPHDVERVGLLRGEEVVRELDEVVVVGQEGEGRRQPDSKEDHHLFPDVGHLERGVDDD